MQQIISKIRKRDGRIVDFDQEKITNAIFKAAQFVGGHDRILAEGLCDSVVDELIKSNKEIPTVEEIQDVVEKVLIKNGHAKTAKAYILYRAKRAELRKSDTKIEIDAEESAFLHMFAHKSKLSFKISYDRLESYKSLILYLKEMQKSGNLPTHSDYLDKNELAINIYQKKYYLKDLNNHPIEKRPDDVFARLAAFVAAVETPEEQKDFAERFYRLMYEGFFLPGGRVIAGAGDLYRLKTLANCFVSLIEHDNIESIYKAAYECARTYSYGGGIGVDISVLRPKDSVVHNAADSSTGSVSFMEIYSLTTGLIGQSGRRGALMLTMDVKHPDSPLFINVKKIPNWVTNQIVEQCRWSGQFNETQLREIQRQIRENIQVRFANISLKISDEFMQSVEEHKTYGSSKILVYEKNKAVSSMGVSQSGSIHYSYGIQSKPIEHYKFLAAFDNIADLNKFLTKCSAEELSETELNNRSYRDIFGDLVISQNDENTELAIRYAGDFMLYYNSPETGEIKRLIKAFELWNSFIDGNYHTAEPGLIFWNTMTKYSPSNYVGRPISSTNPCVAADSLITTAYGLERIDSIKAENIVVDKRVVSESSYSLLSIQYGCELVKLSNRVITGYKDCYKLETKSGYEIIATPEHKILTNEGWKELAEITKDDYVFIQSGAGYFNIDPKLPFELSNNVKGKNGRIYKLNLPTEWSRDLGLFLGWLVGDGFYNETYHKVGLVFSKEDEEAKKIIKPIFEKYCNKQIKDILYRNGCVQIRSSSKYMINFLKKLGIKQANEEREVPQALFTATEDAVIGFLEGLFSSDGTIGLRSKSRNYVRLNSSSLKLLKQVQLLLLNLGIKSTIYDRSKQPYVFSYVNKHDELINYKTSGIGYELNVSKENAARLIGKISFIQSKNKQKVILLKKFEFYRERFEDRVKSIGYVGKREVWDITEPLTHSFIANGIIVHNCAEVPLEDGGACNLGSINLSRFVIDGYTKDARIDWVSLKEATTLAVRFLDNVVTWNEVLNPIEKQRKAAYETRRLGLGIMGIADMLNQLGIGYDSEESLEILEKTAKLFANSAYTASAFLAEEKGTSSIFEYEAYSKGAFFKEVLDPETKELVRSKGLRNIALLSIAPTGTISSIVLGYKLGNKNFIGVSGGIEPIFALYYTRRSESFGNKLFRVFHSTVDAYIQKYRLSDKVQNSRDINELNGILPAHFFRTSHFIEPSKRILIQALWQKYIDHSISSTVNLPQDVEPEVISNIYFDAWKRGLKGITIYRESSRYPILSTEGKLSEFDAIKNKKYVIQLDDNVELEKNGDDIILLSNNRLTTVYHALKNNMLHKEGNIYKLGMIIASVASSNGVFAAQDIELSECPACKLKTLKIENGCNSCINEACGFGECGL